MKLTRKHGKSRKAGFSLAELMVVIVIIGLLATLVVPNVVSKLFVANTKKAVSDITSIVGALNQYAIENNGQYPEGLDALVTKDANGNSFIDRDTIPIDPWKNEYQYEPPGSGGTGPRVFTLGADGAPGGEGKNQDIDNLMIKNGEI